MGKILDYEQMMEKLDAFNNFVKENKSIGTTQYGYPIRHFTYGKGKYHIILTAGTHASELITNHFLINLMEKLNIEPFVDKDKYTIHFLPIINPEGTIIVTSAIRTLIPRDIKYEDEQILCTQYYLNSKLEDKFVSIDNNKDIKLQNWMFRYANYNVISDKHQKLKENIRKLYQKYKYPKGTMIQWSSNGSGIDLNANIENPRYLDEVINKIDIYNELRLNTIKKNVPGPVGCPTRGKTFKYEKENIALWNFYADLVKNKKVIGSLIYHSCGGKIVYLDKLDEINPWNKDYDERYFAYNKEVASKYKEITGYDFWPNVHHKIFDTKLKTLVLGTLLIELATIRSNPLSQFIDRNNQYADTMDLNMKALNPVFNAMLEQYHILNKNS